MSRRSVIRRAGLAGELVQSKVDIIFTPWGTAAALAAKRATATIPVVIGAAGDPVGAGIVASLSKPGGNVLGLTIPESVLTRADEVIN